MKRATAERKLTATHYCSPSTHTHTLPAPSMSREGVRFPFASPEAVPYLTLEVVSIQRHAVSSAAIGQTQQPLRPAALVRVALSCEQPKECAVCYSCVLV